MKRRLQHWLESKGWAPSYGGGILIGLAIFFFLAGTNTLAGWLFVMCGVTLALLLFGLSGKPWQTLTAQMNDPEPVAVGEALVVALHLHTEKPTRMLQLVWAAQDLTVRYALDSLAGSQTVLLQAMPQTRGIYRWQTLTLRSAAPLGLWWQQKAISCAQSVIVYPQVLPLQQCPLLTAAGPALRDREQSSVASDAMQGYTRALRPYRRGDPMRLIHWRSSARYGELRTRELESVGSGTPYLIAIDHRPGWLAVDFEAALIVAASLYDWGKRQGLELALWISNGLISGERHILSTLAELQPTASHVEPPPTACLWLTADPATSSNGHIWLGWGEGRWQGLGRRIDPEQDLAWQLQTLTPIDYR